MPRLVSFHQRRYAWQFAASNVLFFRILALAFWRRHINAKLSICNVQKRLLGSVGSGLGFVHIIKAGILLILFSSGGLASIAFLAEGEI